MCVVCHRWLLKRVFLMVRRLRVKIANSFGNFLFHRRKHANVREEKEEEEEEEEKEEEEGKTVSLLTAFQPTIVSDVISNRLIVACTLFILYLYGRVQ